jgi:hypothetical protein
MSKSITAFGAIALAAGTASAELTVTEAFVGLSGEDGTVDWFELTNTGNSAMDTASLVYDDDSADIADGGQLDSFMLAPGESAVFLISDDNEPSNEDDFTTATGEFDAIWGAGINVGLTNGGGNLGQGGDAINLFSVSDMMLISTTDTPGALSGNLQTIDFVSGATASVLGVNGAFESNPFFNDNLGLPGNEAILVGSPGVIPAPGAAALLSVAGLAAARRRR